MSPSTSTPAPVLSGPSAPGHQFVFDEFSDSEAAKYYAERYGPLGVDKAIDLILADERIRQERERRLRSIPPPPPPVVPRRKPLQPPVPPTVPLTRRELASRITPRPTTIPLKDRITTPPTYIHPVQPLPIGVDFEKVKPEELAAIYASRIKATSTRITAVLEYKAALRELPPDQYKSLERLVDALVWARRHTDEAHTWSKKERDSLKWGCQSIGKVKFHALKTRFWNIVEQLVEVEKGGYFDWIAARK